MRGIWWIPCWSQFFGFCAICGAQINPGDSIVAWLFPPYRRFTRRHWECHGPVRENVT